MGCYLWNDIISFLKFFSFLSTYMSTYSPPPLPFACVYLCDMVLYAFRGGVLQLSWREHEAWDIEIEWLLHDLHITYFHTSNTEDRMLWTRLYWQYKTFIYKWWVSFSEKRNTCFAYHLNKKITPIQAGIVGQLNARHSQISMTMRGQLFCPYTPWELWVPRIIRRETGEMTKWHHSDHFHTFLSLFTQWYDTTSYPLVW